MAIQNPVTMSTVDSSGNSVPIESTGGAVPVADVGIPRLAHIRYNTGITATIATGTKTGTFEQSENVRQIRFYLPADTLFRVVFDAASLDDAKAKLATAIASETVDVQYHPVQALADSGATAGWSDWYRFSEIASDPSLGRYDIVADAAAGPHTTYAEGR